jgi:hypothetical protein
MPETPISDEEIERLASDEGWDESEVDAIRAYLGRSETSGPAADEPAAERPSSDAATEQPAEPAAPASSPLDQDWLRGRRGPAATAYRRLRRLIQG